MRKIIVRNNLSKPIFLSLMSLLLATPVAAQDFSRISNDLIPKEPNFFTQGREQFERELQLLLERNRVFGKTILKVSPEPTQIQEQLKPLENPQVAPSDSHRSNSQELKQSN